jgi:hypothetical protein
MRLEVSCSLEKGRMNMTLCSQIRLLSLAFAGALAVTAAAASSASAATVADPDLFDGTVTLNVSGTFANAAFVAGNLVDGQNNAFVFDDGGDVIRELSISGFNSAIAMLRIFDTPSYTERVALSVDLYYSAVSQTSLLTADYTFEGTYALGPTANIGGTGAHDVYTTLTSPADHPDAGEPGAKTGATIGYADVTGLSIPNGTQSILLVLTGSSSNGIGISEIQAFAPAAVPTPTALPAGLGLLALMALRRRLSPGASY